MYLPESLQEVPGQIVVFSAVRKPGDDIGLKPVFNLFEVHSRRCVKVLKQPSVALLYLLQFEIFNAPSPDELPEALSCRAALCLMYELVNELLL